MQILLSPTPPPPDRSHAHRGSERRARAVPSHGQDAGSRIDPARPSSTQVAPQFHPGSTLWRPQIEYALSPTRTDALAYRCMLRTAYWITPADCVPRTAYCVLLTAHCVLRSAKTLRTAYCTTTYCVLRIAYCKLGAAHCITTADCGLRTAYCVLHTAHCSTAYCELRAAYNALLLRTAYCVLRTVYCVVRTACCMPYGVLRA